MLEILADEAQKALQFATEETTKLIVPAAVGAAFAGATNLRQLLLGRITTLPKDPEARTAKIMQLLEADPEFRTMLFQAVAQLRAQGLDLSVPPPPAGFKDRTNVLPGLGEPGTRTVIGPPGWGKTYVVQQVLHIRAGAYADGNAFIDCRQFRTAGALRYAEVFGAVLRQIGLAVDETSDAALSTRYERALLHGRFLLVFDNVEGVAEARALARNWPLSLVLLTAREMSDDLAAWCPTPPVLLGGLDGAGARDLLAEKASKGVLDAEAEATRQLLDMCDSIPAFLCRAGATLQLRRRDFRPVARLVTELRAGDGGPRGFDEILTSLGVRSLPESVVADLALLGGHPGGFFTRDSADALLGHSAGTTIDTLLAAGLAVGGPNGQLRLLRLVKQRVTPAPAEKDVALRRLLAEVVEHAMAADQALEGDRLRPAGLPGGLSWRLPHLTPIEYLDMHAGLIVDLVQFAHHGRLHRDALRLCGALEIVLTYRSRYHLVATAVGWGIKSAELLGDDFAAARLHATRARIETALGLFGAAHISLDTAAGFGARANHPRLNSSLLEFRARLAREQAQHEIDLGAPATAASFAEAARLIRQALEIDRAHHLDRARGIHARELANLEVRAGRPHEAMTLFDEAERFTDAGRPRNVSRIHLGRGRAHDLLAQWIQVDSEVATARKLVAASGADTYDLEIDDLVAESAWHRGDLETARLGWDRLAERFYAMAHPRYDRYKAKLRQHPPAPG